LPPCNDVEKAGFLSQYFRSGSLERLPLQRDHDLAEMLVRFHVLERLADVGK
jgi:hypothetical protein